MFYTKAVFTQSIRSILLAARLVKSTTYKAFLLGFFSFKMQHALGKELFPPIGGVCVSLSSMLLKAV